MAEVRQPRPFITEELLEKGIGLSPATRRRFEQLAPVTPIPSGGGSPFDAFLPESTRLTASVAPEVPSAEPERPSILGEFGAGLQAGVRGFVPLGAGLGSVVLQAFGAEETARELAQFGLESEESILRDLPPTVTFEEAFSSPGNFARFALRNLGEQVPIIASIIISGGAGFLVGRLVGRGALTLAEGTAGLGRFGATTGAIAGATGIETGATAQELFGAVGEAKPFASFTAGIAKGALEAVVPLALASRFGLKVGVAEGIIARAVSFLDKAPTRLVRVGAGAGAAAVAEAVTEFLQEAVDVGTRSYVDDNFDVTSPETRNRLLESAFVGALVGAVFGGIGGAIGGRGVRGETPLTELPPGETPLAGVTPEGNLVPPAVPKGPPAGPPTLPPPAAPGEPEVVAPPPVFPDLPPAPVIPEVTAQPIDENTKQVLQDAGFTDFEIRGVAGASISEEQRQKALDGFMFDGSELVQVTQERVDQIQLGHEVIITVRREQLDKFIAKKGRFEGAHANIFGSDSPAVTLEEAEAFVERGNINFLNKVKRQFARAQAATTTPAPVAPAPVPIAPGATKADVREALRQATIPTRDVSTFIKLARRVFITEGTSLDDAVRNLEDMVALEPERVAFRGDLLEAIQGEDPSEAVRLKRLMVDVLSDIRTAPAAGEQSRQDNVDLLISLGLIVKIADPKAQRMFEFVADRGISEEELDGTERQNFNTRGVSYDPSKHKPGTAEIVSGDPGAYMSMSPKGRASARKLRDAFTDMLKLFGMKDEKLIVAINSWRNQEGEIDELGELASGSASMVSDDRSLILIRSSVFERGDALELATISTHEFGHVLTWKRFAQADPGTQIKLLNAFNAQVQKGSVGDLRDFVTALRPADLVDFFTTFGDLKDPALSVSRISQNPDYWFNFAEFLADQVARWYQSNQQPLTRLEKFFKNLSREMRKLYQRLGDFYGLRREDFRAEDFVQEWIDSLATGKEIGAFEALRDSVQNSLADSSVENDGATGETDSTAAAELGESIERIALGAGVSRKQARKARAGVDRINWFLKWGLTLRQLTQLNPQIGGLRIYNELMDAWNNAATQWKSRADSTIKEWRSLSPQSQGNLARFIFEVDAMNYLGKDEAARQPTPEELLVLAKKYHLTNEAFVAFQQIRTDLTDFLTAIEDVLIQDIKDTIDNELIQQVRIAKVNQEFAKLKQRPYFPHSRFGDFTVVVKAANEKGEAGKGKTAHMEQFATRQEARNTLGKIKLRFPEEDGFVSRVDKIPEEAKPFRGLPPALLEQLKSMPKLTQTQRIWIEQLVVGLSPAESFRKRLSRRKDVPGFSLDAMRGYADYFWHGSNYLARIQFQRPLQEAINSVNAEASDPAFALAQPGQDVSQRRRIADFMQNHMDQILNPAPDWAQVRSIAFIWWLGFAPNSAILNLTQVPMVGLPFLSARYGAFKAGNALRRAMGAIPRMMKKDTGDVTDDFLIALTRAVENGVVDESYATELAATAEGANLTGLLPGSKAQRASMKIAHWSAFMFQTSEKFNRRTMFKAAWDLAMADPENSSLAELQELNQLEFRDLIGKGFSETEARAYLAGRDAVWGTQFQYSRHARPRFMRGRKGVIFTFFTFVQQMLFFAAHDRGRTQFFLVMFVLAGMMGLPFAEDVNAFVRFTARKLLGKDVDIERIAREFVVDIMGEDSISPDLILHGISRVGFGIPAAADLLGIPMPKFDMSASVGLGRIIPGLETIGPPSRSFDAGFSRFVTQASGASAGIGINLMRFLSDDALDFGDSKRYERAFPRAIKNVLKGIRFGTEGRERTRSGATVLEFDTSDPDQLAEVVGQALGFTPTRLSRKWDRQRMKQEAEAFLLIRRGMIMRQFDTAVQSGDRAVIKDMVAAVRRYNKDADPGFKISSRELRQSQRERARRRRLFELGRPARRGSARLSRDIDKLFPEVVDVEHSPR